MLQVKKLVKKYNSFEALKGIDFEIKPNSIYGLLGRNGAGKTTTMNILTGLIHYDSGEISFNGIDYKHKKREIIKDIGYTPQSPVFYGYMTALEYLSFIGTLTNMTVKEVNKRSIEILEMVGLKEASKRRLSGFSGGMKQRFGIAVALFNKPSFLILDEPTAALDPEGRMEVLNMMKNLKEEGVTILLSTHILNDIERICDDVSIIDEGKILISDSLSSLKADYIQPIFDIEVKDDATAIVLETTLAKLPFVNNIKTKYSTVSVYVKNIEIAKDMLLKELSKGSFGISSYSLRKSSLEDIFIRLVNKNE